MDFPVFVIVMVFLVGVAGPIAKGIAARIARAGAPSTIDAKRLEAALLLAEQRIAESEQRIGSMEERLDFYEKLLGESERQRQLPR
jgi:hypothetical protein